MANSILLSTIKIGTQEWATKNLDVIAYSDGTLIPQITDSATWRNTTLGAWCYYSNNTANGTVYGKLYNWYAVAGIWNTASLTDITKRKKLAPVGYHVPTDAEWTTLSTYLGGESIAGGKMKEAGTTHWDATDADTTNINGFTAIPGGFRIVENGQFYYLGSTGIWWSSSLNGNFPWFRAIGKSSKALEKSIDSKNNGYSVRVLVDNIIDPACTFTGNMTIVYPTPTTTTKTPPSTTTTTKKPIPPTSSTTTTTKPPTTTTTTKKPPTITTTTTKAKICTLAGTASVVTPPVVYFTHSVIYGTITCSNNAVVFNASATMTVYSSSNTLIPGISLWQNKELTIPVTVSAIKSVVNCWKLNVNTLGITMKIGGVCLVL